MSENDAAHTPSFFNIPDLLASRYTHVTHANDRTIEDAVQIVNNLVASGKEWHLLIVQKGHGMVLLRRGLQGTPYQTYAIWLHTPSCGEATPEAEGTARIIHMLDPRQHSAVSILASFVVMYDHFKIRNLDTVPVYEPL